MLGRKPAHNDMAMNPFQAPKKKYFTAEELMLMSVRDNGTKSRIGKSGRKDAAAFTWKVHMGVVCLR